MQDFSFLVSIDIAANETSSSTCGSNGIASNGQSSAPAIHQNTLDEITNKVFNELLQRKVDAHSHGLKPKMPTSNHLPASELVQSQLERDQSFQIQSQAPPQHQQNIATSSAMQVQPKRLSDAEDGGGRSDDWCSETSSSNVGQLRQQPIAKGRAFVAANRHRKYTITPSVSMSLISSAANAAVVENGPMKITPDGSVTDESSKKPLIAIWKAGVKLQNASAPTTTAQAENNGTYFYRRSCCHSQLLTISLTISFRFIGGFEASATISFGGSTRHRNQFRIAGFSQRQRWP